MKISESVDGLLFTFTVYIQVFLCTPRISQQGQSYTKTSKF